MIRARLCVLILCLGVMVFSQGCTKLNSSVPFRYVNSLSSGETCDVSVAFEKFVDNRPKKDRKTTKTIMDIDEKVTSKMIEDFRASQIFTQVDYPARPATNDYIIKGSIERFAWKCDLSPIVFIPFVNLVIYFGVPMYYVEGVADFDVQLVEAKTGTLVKEYKKNAIIKDEYTLYSMTAGEAGAELADSFRETAKQIKEAIYNDLQAKN